MNAPRTYVCSCSEQFRSHADEIRHMQEMVTHCSVLLDKSEAEFDQVEEYEQL